MTPHGIGEVPDADAASAGLRSASPASEPLRPVDYTPILVHDLRGPLSVLSMNLEFLRDALAKVEPSDPAQHAIDDCRDAVDKLFRMVANVLDLARAQAGELKPPLTPASVGTLIEDVAASHRAEAATREVDIGVELASADMVIETNPDLFSRALDALVGYAMRLVRPRTRLGIVARIDERFELEILAPSSELRRDDFDRLARPRSDAGGRAELKRTMQLTIARYAASALGGTLEASYGADDTLSLRLRLPRMASNGATGQ